MPDRRRRHSSTLAAALAALVQPWLSALPAPARAEEAKAAPAAAQPAAKEPAREKVRKAAEEARDKVAAAKDEAREKLEAARAEAHEKMKEAREEMKAAHEEMKAKVGAAREELREAMHAKVDQVLGPPEDRAQRAREHRRREMHALRPHWKRGSDIPPQVREALRSHARRTARLERIRALAEAKGDKAAVERCDKLLELARAHHQKRMEKLTPKTEAGASPQAPAAAKVAAPAEAAEAEDDEKAPEEKAAEETP